MQKYTFIILLAVVSGKCSIQAVYESDVNFRVDAGAKTCIFEHGQAGQVIEVYYQVLDGQHGELDISLDIIDPNAKKILSDYKKSQNNFIKELEVSGDYAICLDNTYSLVNSKLVFVNILIEFKKDEEKEGKQEEIEGIDKEEQQEEHEDTEVADGSTEVEAEEEEQNVEEVHQWEGHDENGETYVVEMADIAESLTRTLKHVMNARRLLEIYGATKARDSYVAFEDTFIVDVWSGLQITLMIVVGLTQVYMIKKLFCPTRGIKSVVFNK